MPRFLCLALLLPFFILATANEGAEEGQEEEDDYTRCTHRPSRGPCKGHLYRYYFNPRRGKCRLFIYGGCGGNSNNFRHRYECMKSCMKGKHHVPHECFYLLSPLKKQMEGSRKGDRFHSCRLISPNKKETPDKSCLEMVTIEVRIANIFYNFWLRNFRLLFLVACTHGSPCHKWLVKIILDF